METKEPKTRSALEKLLIGCALGCGVLIVVGLMVGSFGAYWFFSPGEQVATGQIVGEDSVALVRLNELATDPGTQALLTTFLRALDKVNRRQQEQILPESMRWLTRFQRSSKASDFNRFIPREATLVVEMPEGATDPAVVVAVNFRTMVRPVKAMFALIGRSEGREDFHSRYRDYDVYRLSQDDDAFVSFVGSTLLFASAEPTLRTAIDRIEGVIPSGAERLTRDVPEGTWDAAGVVANEQGAAVDVIRKLLDDEDLEPPGGDEADLDLRFGLDIVTADEIAAQIYLDCEDEAQAKAWLEILEGHFEALKEHASDMGLTLEVEAAVRERRIVAELRLTGIEAAIESTIQIGGPGDETDG